MASEYDFIIVGGGNAGCVLAARLSELQHAQVLLLETGGDHSSNPAVAIPGSGKALWSDAEVNWDYKTVPQTSYNGRSITHPRGKGLGGTTLLNLNCMTFTDKESYNNFGRIGNPGWSYETMQPYLRKFHTYHEPSQHVKDRLGLHNLDPSVHGLSGPIQVSYGNYHTGPLNEAWPRTFEALGKKSTTDPLSGTAQGAVNAPGTVTPGSWTRSYAAGAYLTPEVRARANLTVITKAHAEKVVFDGTVAKGVLYKDSDGQDCTVNGREVIFCGGVFNSPQLLELSGIGAKALLDNLGITTIADLPGVGENLQDHSIVGLSLEANIETFDSFRDPAKRGAVFKQYQDDKSGPLTSAIYNQAFLPHQIESSIDGDLSTILERHVNDQSLSAGLRRQYELICKTVTNPSASSIQFLGSPVQIESALCPLPVPDENRLADYITLYASLSHPFSRGTVHITSSDPSTYPAIDPKYFTHPLDVAIMMRHLQYLSTIASTKPLADLIKPGGRTIPVDLDLANPEYVRDVLIPTGFTTYHPSGTCAMMPRELGGVVDERLRVHGVKGLRVVDASVFPLIPRGNIQSSVYAVAERAADLIKEDFGG